MPPRPTPAVRANVSKPVEPLVGRVRALDNLTNRLQHTCQLLTLTGPAGVGKSRLAWATADRLTTEGAFENSVLCDLHGLSSVEALLDALARAAGLDEREATSIEKALDAFGQLLLVLDGFDELVDLAEHTIRRILDAAPSMTCLVTSRRRLELDAEVYELGPMQLPTGPDLDGDAVAYFLHCLQKVRAGYRPTATEAPFVNDLVRELDGLPLALELAAPRLAVMGPAVLLHRLRTSRSLLRATVKNSSEPRSFDTAMEGSWQALSPVERDVLGQLTVFSGGMTAEAVEAVVTLQDASPLIDILQSLRNRSMVQSEVLADGSVRLRILQGLRDFARRRSDPSSLRSARRKHAAYFAQRAAQCAGEARTATGAQAAAWLSCERSNLLNVVDRVASAPHVTAHAAEPALRILLALEPLHGCVAPPREFVALLDKALDSTRDSGADPLLFGRALALRGAMRSAHGRVPAATRDFLQALRLAETLASDELKGAALLGLGRVLLRRGELDEARSHLLGAMDAFQKAGVRRDEALTWHALADLETFGGHPEAAIPLLERAIAWFMRLREPHAEGLARCAAARLHLDLGNTQQVDAQLAAARTLPLGSEHPVQLESDLIHCIALHDAGSRGDYEAIEAAARHRGAVAIEAEALAFQGLAHAQAGRFGQAHALLRAALDLGIARDVPLWAALTAALDARVAPHSLAPSAATSGPSAAGRGSAIESLRAVAAEPSRWGQFRNDLVQTSARCVILRLTVRALDQTSSTAAQPSIPPNALAIGQSGRWFRMPGATTVSLERRRPLARLLDRLAQARRDGAKEALPWDVLQEAGWPGERIIATAGAHRVRVGISTLRKLGLRDALETTPEGYKLAPEITVVCLEEGETLPS